MKLPAYPRTKPSGVEWLGDVPEHWSVKAIKWETPVLRGASPRPIDDPNYFDDDGGEYSWVRISDVTSAGTYLSTTEQKLSRLGSSLSVKLNPGALFLSIAGSVGKPCITQIKCCIHDGFVYFPRFKGDAKFLYYLFASGEPYRGLGKLGTQLNLNTDTVGSIVAGFPDPTEQQAIAAFLDRETGRVDRLVAKKRELIERLKEKRTALIARTVSRGLPPTAARAAGLPENPPFKPSGLDWLGDIPKHWEVLPLKRVAQISYGVGGEIDRSLEDGLRTLSLPNIDFEGKLNLDDVPYAEVSETERRAVLLCKGDLLFNWRNGSSDHLGKTAYFDADGDYSHVSFLLRIRFELEEHCSKFFRYLLGGYRVTGFFKHSKAGVNNTFNLSELSALPVMFPPLPEQAAIAAYLDAETAKLDALVGKVEAAVERLQEYRTALITAAVTGKIDVRGGIAMPPANE